MFAIFSCDVGRSDAHRVTKAALAQKVARSVPEPWVRQRAILSHATRYVVGLNGSIQHVILPRQSIELQTFVASSF